MTYGFTFIRNAIHFDYPVVEAIRSILPLCDGIWVAVGQSDDGTLDLIRSIDPRKVHIVETTWDDSLREGGRVLAVETDKAFDALPADADWCFYIQGDEVLHEDGYDALRSAMARWKDDLTVEGLLLNYKHFWGSYDYVGDTRNWYRREVRVVRRDPAIRSWADAQGFRYDGRKLNVKPVDATMFHYGWVKPPGAQQRKRIEFERLWHDDATAARKIDASIETFDYTDIASLERFTGSHPCVMQERIARINWPFAPPPQRLPFKERLSRAIERLTGHRIGEYRNYELI